MSNAEKIGAANLIRRLTKERQEKEARGERIPEVPFTNADKIGAAALIRKLAMERASREQQEQAAQAAVRAELKRQREAERAAQKAERLRAAQERLTVAKQRLADVRAERAQQKTAKAAARERARAEQTAQATAKRAEFARASKANQGSFWQKRAEKKAEKLSAERQQAKQKEEDKLWVEEKWRKIKEDVRPIDEKWDAELKAATEAKEQKLQEEIAVVQEKVKSKDTTPLGDEWDRAIAEAEVRRKEELRQALADAGAIPLRRSISGPARGKLPPMFGSSPVVPPEALPTHASERGTSERMRLAAERARAENERLEKLLQEDKKRREQEGNPESTLDQLGKRLMESFTKKWKKDESAKQPTPPVAADAVVDAAAQRLHPDKDGYYFPEDPSAGSEKELDPKISKETADASPDSHGHQKRLEEIESGSQEVLRKSQAFDTALKERTRMAREELEQVGLKPDVLERTKRWYAYVRDAYDQLPAYQKLAVFGAYIGGSVAFTGGVSTALLATKSVLPTILWNVVAPVGLGATAGFAHYRSLRRRGYDSESAQRSASRVYIAATAAIAIGSIKLTSILSSYFAPPPPEPSGVWEKYMKKYIPGL